MTECKLQLYAIQLRNKDFPDLLLVKFSRILRENMAKVETACTLASPKISQCCVYQLDLFRLNSVSLNVNQAYIKIHWSQFRSLSRS